MGLDFVQKAKPQIIKGWSKGQEELCSPDLFSRSPEEDQPPTLLFIKTGDGRVEVGSEVVLSTDGDKLVARQGIPIIATAVRPPDDLIRAIRARSNCALGRVTGAHSQSGVLDIAVR